MIRTRVTLTLAALATAAASGLASPAASASTLSAHALASDPSVPVSVLGVLDVIRRPTSVRPRPSWRGDSAPRLAS